MRDRESYDAGRRDAWLRVLDAAIDRLLGIDVEKHDAASLHYARVVSEAEEARSALRMELAALGDEQPADAHLADMVRQLAKWANDSAAAPDDARPAPEPSVRHERDGEVFTFEPLPSLCECGSNTWVFTHISMGPDAKACARCARCEKAIELAQQTGEGA